MNFKELEELNSKVKEMNNRANEELDRLFVSLKSRTLLYVGNLSKNIYSRIKKLQEDGWKVINESELEENGQNHIEPEVLLISQADFSDLIKCKDKIDKDTKIFVTPNASPESQKIFPQARKFKEFKSEL